MSSECSCATGVEPIDTHDGDKQRARPYLATKALTNAGGGAMAMYIPYDYGYRTGSFVKVSIAKCDEDWKDPITFVAKVTERGGCKTFVVPAHLKHFVTTADEVMVQVYEYDPMCEPPVPTRVFNNG